MISVLLTGLGAPGTPGTVHCLRNNGERDVRLVGCDMDPDPDNAHLVDSVWPSLPPEHPEYLDKIRGVCALSEINVIVPQTTREVEALSRTKARRYLMSETGAHVACADGYAVRQANDKGSVMAAFHMLGLPAPEFMPVKAISDLFAARDHFGYPFVVKPRAGNGSRGVRIVRPGRVTAEDFISTKPGSLDICFRDLCLILRGEFPEMIAMEYLPGDEYTVDCFRGTQMQAAVPRLRKKTRGGITTHAVVDMREDLIDYSLTAAKHLNLTGAFGFQFKMDRDGTPKVIESNPRVQGTMVTSFYAGLNAPWLAVREALCDFPNEYAITPGKVEFRRVWDGIGFVDKRVENEVLTA